MRSSFQKTLLSSRAVSSSKQFSVTGKDDAASRFSWALDSSQARAAFLLLLLLRSQHSYHDV